MSKDDTSKKETIRKFFSGNVEALSRSDCFRSRFRFCQNLICANPRIGPIVENRVGSVRPLGDGKIKYKENIRQFLSGNKRITK